MRFGFAGGVMCWVAFMELLLEAYEDTDMITTGVASLVALAITIGIQRSIDEHGPSSKKDTRISLAIHLLLL